MKRIFDILISAILLIPIIPVMLGVAVCILLSDGRPVFFSQMRVGRGGKNFKLWKFRSMIVDSEKVGSFSTGTNDPRITKIGRFIRRTSIDELPQLFNVILGDMSLVGPRPDVPQQRLNYSQEEWDLRVSAKPGITGLAQATLRSDATPEERLALDLDYVRSNGLLIDMNILLKTAIQVLGKGGN
ncbi:sugar transferase [Sphingorhabdus sp.]|uniref:sugar transferase n=1 Tax=Sphingorhabdus sp. TaxID=1902408 RepID=UPI00391D9B11